MSSVCTVCTVHNLYSNFLLYRYNVQSYHHMYVNIPGLGTEIKMNIDINFSITEIQLLNIDINFDISKFRF